MKFLTIIILSLVFITNNIYATEIKILILPKINTNAINKDMAKEKKNAINDAIKMLSKKYHLSKNSFIVVNLNSDNKKEYKKNIEILKTTIKKNKNSIALIWTTYSTAQVIKNLKLLDNLIGMQMENIPIITKAGTMKVLDDFTTNQKLSIFTTSSLSKTKADIVYKYAKLEKYTNVIYLGAKDMCNNNSVSSDLYTNEEISSLRHFINKDNKQLVYNQFFLESNCSHSISKAYPIIKNKHKKVLIVLGEESRRKTKEIYDNLSWRLNTILYLNNNYNTSVYLMRVDEKDKNLFYDKFPVYFTVYDLLSKDVSIYSKMKSKIVTELDMSLHGLKHVTKGTEEIKKIRYHIFKNLKGTCFKHPYYNKKYARVISFHKAKNSNYFFNSSYSTGINSLYITRLDGGFQRLAKTQITSLDPIKMVPAIYAEIIIDKIDIKTLSADSAKVEFHLKTLSSNIKNIKKYFNFNFLQDNNKHQSIKLISSDQVKSETGEVFYKNIYKVIGYFNIENKLFKFPFDTQKLTITLDSKIINNNAVKNVIFNTIIKKDNIRFDQWNIVKTEYFLRNKINVFSSSKIIEDSSVSTKPYSKINIYLERNSKIEVALKYIIPVFILLILILITFFHLYKQTTQDTETEIFISSLAGIISIYFIFSLLIDISELILFDLFFFLIITIVVILIIINIKRYKIVKDKHNHINVIPKE